MYRASLLTPRLFLLAAAVQVMEYSDLVELGNESAVKAAGKYRQKGKEYVVQVRPGSRAAVAVEAWQGCGIASTGSSFLLTRMLIVMVLLMMMSSVHYHHHDGGGDSKLSLLLCATAVSLTPPPPPPPPPPFLLRFQPGRRCHLLQVQRDVRQEEVSMMVPAGGAIADDTAQ